MLFAGTIEAKADAKGRVFFPSDFRRQLPESDSRIVLRRDAYQPCLVACPFSVWQREVELLRSRLNRWQPQEAMLFRQFLAGSHQTALDANGRLLLPKRLAEQCALGTAVTFVGADDRVEIWDAATMNAAFLTPEAMADAMAAVAGRLVAQPESNA